MKNNAITLIDYFDLLLLISIANLDLASINYRYCCCNCYYCYCINCFVATDSDIPSCLGFNYTFRFNCFNYIEKNLIINL